MKPWLWRPGLLALADGSVFEGEVLARSRARAAPDRQARPGPPPARSSSTR